MTRKKSTGQNSKKAAGAAASAATQKTRAKEASRKVSKKKTTAKRNSSASKPATVNSDVRQTHNTREPYPLNNIGKYALAASLLALALSVYAVYETTLSTRISSVQVAGMGERLTNVSTAQQGLVLDLGSQKTRSEEELNRIDNTLSAMESTVVKLELAAQESIDDIKANLGESVARWKLDEIHSLLTRVTRVYQLTGEQAQAIAGLELVQSSLATIDNPRLAEVNTALAEDMLRVKADRSVDIVSINDQLVSMISLVPDLVLAEDARAAAVEPESAEEASDGAQDDGILAAGKTLFSDIGSLVKYKNMDIPIQPSLDEQGRFAVYESLRLQLHAVMVALLRRDNASYQSQLTLADETLSRYFDTEQAVAQTLRDQIQVLQSFDVSLDAQAISRALTALNRMMTMEK